MMMNEKFTGADYSAKEYAKVFTTNWLPQQIDLTEPGDAIISWLPDIAKKPLLTILGVKDFPTARRVEPLWMEMYDVPSEKRMYQNTNDLAKMLGNTNVAKEFGWSPLQIENGLNMVAERMGEMITGKILSGKEEYAASLRAAFTKTMKQEYGLFWGREYNEAYKDYKKIKQEYNRHKDAKYGDEGYDKKHEVKNQKNTYKDVFDFMHNLRKDNNEGEIIPPIIHNHVHDMIKNLKENKFDKVKDLLEDAQLRYNRMQFPDKRTEIIIGN